MKHKRVVAFIMSVIMLFSVSLNDYGLVLADEISAYELMVDESLESVFSHEEEADSVQEDEAGEFVGEDELFEDDCHKGYPESLNGKGILQNYTSGATTTAEVIRRLNELREAFPNGSYFSANGMACENVINSSTHSCGNCSYLAVMNSLGISPIAELKDAWTCFGFTFFVYYYLFHEYLINSRIKVITCKGADIVKYALPGDAIYTGGKHYWIYAGEENGLPVKFESNWCGTNKVHYGPLNVSGTSIIYRNPAYAETVGTSGKVPVDTLAPKISDLRYDNVTEDGYDISCVVTDDFAVASVKFASWTTPSIDSYKTPESGNALYKDGVLSGGRYTCHIARSEHEDKYAIYRNWVFAEDTSGNKSDMSADIVSVGTYAQKFDKNFDIRIASKASTAFQVAYIESTVPKDALVEITDTSMRVWSEEKGVDYVVKSETDEKDVEFPFPIDGGMRVGGSGDSAYRTMYSLSWYPDKYFGFAKGKYHVSLSVRFSDGSVINKYDEIELKNEGHVMSEKEWNGHRYILFFDNLSWEEAEKACEDMGGHLVTITSQEEYDALTDWDTGLLNFKTEKDSEYRKNDYGETLLSILRDYFYTGGVVDRNTGKIRWITGENDEFEKWEENRENSVKDDSMVVLKDVMASVTAKFSTWEYSTQPSDSIKCGYICEIDGMDTGSRFSLSDKEIELKVGDSRRLSASMFPSSRADNIVLFSSDQSVVSIKDDMVMAVGKGEATVTAWDENGQFSDTCKVKVDNVPVTSLTMESGEVKLKIGETDKLNVTVLPENATNKEIEWKCSDMSVATVSDNGLVTAIAEGMAVITAVSADSPEVFANCIVIVENADSKESEIKTTVDSVIFNVKENGGTNIKLDTEYKSTVSYCGLKHVSQYNKPGKKYSNDIKLVLRSSVLDYATPVVKFKNNTAVPVKSGKEPYFKLSFKAKGTASRDQKNIIKAVNKELKNKTYRFNIMPLDIGRAKNAEIKFDGAGEKIKRVVLTVDDRKYKLTSKQYSYKTGNDGSVTIIAADKTNFTGEYKWKK